MYVPDSVRMAPQNIDNAHFPCFALSRSFFNIWLMLKPKKRNPLEDIAFFVCPTPDRRRSDM